MSNFLAHNPINIDISIDNSICLIGHGEKINEFLNQFGDKYELTNIALFSGFSGSIGNFIIDYEESSQIKQKRASQIIFFTQHKMTKKQLGVHFISDFKSQNELIAEIDSLIGEFSFERSIFYSENKCQFHHRDKNEFSYCAACADVCPTSAIVADFDKKELNFSDVDCITCGLCVAVCPSGAMQKMNFKLKDFNNALKKYKNKHIIFCNDELDSANLAQNVAIVKLPNINLLNEVYLLCACQETGAACVICGEVGEILDESIHFINEIYLRIFKLNAVHKIASLNELDSLKLEALSAYSYDVDESEFSREILNARLKYFIKNSDFGVIKNSQNVVYTDILLDSNKCTLCMGCVEVCNASAFISQKDGFGLLLNPSFCTACGICADICPEKIIKLDFGGFRLNNHFLNYAQKAKDEPFHCVECGKIIASNKSIQKVSQKLLPIFGKDSPKSRALLCCSDCKVKIMFGE